MVMLSRRRVRIIGSTVAVVTLLVGVYMLLLVSTPTIMNIPAIREAKSRAVTKKLETTQPKPAENRLYIEKIGVDVAIVTGNNDSVLQKGAWHRKPENGSPTTGGNFVLSAHRFLLGYTPEGTAAKSPFYHLDALMQGDTIKVDYEGKRYEYEVTKRYKVKPNRTEIEQRSETTKLTLYSCTFRGSADGREVIEAVLKNT